MPRSPARDRQHLGLSSGEVAKLTALVALLAIFFDAVLGHGLAWENDPYWTYWITKTFLIATVFGLGTAWVGVGVKQGAAITAVHTLILTIYYWTLSPIGLPSHTDWLDVEHTWISGLPIHYGVIFLGYLAALWVWRRRAAPPSTDADPPSALGARALGAAVAIVVIAGGLVSLALWELPGVTWLVVRLLITVPFLLAWYALVGRDRLASLVGAVVLALTWAAYGHFLGPVGLPDTPLRVLETASPPATVSWLGYHDLWLTSLPLYLLAAVVVMQLAARRDRRAGSVDRRQLLTVFVVPFAIIVALGGWLHLDSDERGTPIDLHASGAVRVETGSYYRGSFEDGSGMVRLRAIDRGARVSPLPPHDVVDLKATLDHPDGTTYTITAQSPMVEDPLGRFTTWWGVGTDVWHHGRTGVGSNRLPAVRSEVGVFALGEVRADGERVANGVLVHLMTGDGDHDDTSSDRMAGELEIDVGDPDAPVPGLPQGHLRFGWSRYSGGASDDPHGLHYAFGGFTLLAFLLWALALLRADTPDPSR